MSELEGANLKIAEQQSEYYHHRSRWEKYEAHLQESLLVAQHEQYHEAKLYGDRQAHQQRSVEAAKLDAINAQMQAECLLKEMAQAQELLHYNERRSADIHCLESEGYAQQLREAEGLIHDLKVQENYAHEYLKAARAKKVLAGGRLQSQSEE